MSYFYSKTIGFERGNEYWELEAEFSVEGPEYDVGIMGYYCTLEKIEFFAPRAVWMRRRTVNSPLISPLRKEGRWLPFALSSAEREAIEQRESEFFEPDFGDDW